ncbi:hypothetical protein [Vitiosangium sp. GDMCC 1.1324]|uniref:hypothetical protein n=1 Tax=Vitiosangium sp. (strain GDMCC 1.1324) TaxID=2138576 RepID=UPI00130E12A7|nr:hypothetical protein [Vitiosangium sp. GDMCC 1.1324]
MSGRQQTDGHAECRCSGNQDERPVMRLNPALTEDAQTLHFEFRALFPRVY